MSTVLLSEKSRCGPLQERAGQLFGGGGPWSNGYLSVIARFTLLGGGWRADGQLSDWSMVGRQRLRFHRQTAPTHRRPCPAPLSFLNRLVLLFLLSLRFIPDDLPSPIRCDAGRGTPRSPSRYHPQQHHHRTAIVHPVLRQTGPALLSLRRR